MLGVEEDMIEGVPVCSNKNGETLLEPCPIDETYVSELLVIPDPLAGNPVCSETKVVEV